MAAQQFTLELTPADGTIKKDVVISTPLVDPTSNEIWVGIGADVPTRRGTEILSAIALLASGVRDRNLIEYGSPDFAASTMVTAVSIDNITTTNRRTAADLATAVAAADDVVLAMGDAVTDIAGYKVVHEAAIEQLSRAVQEWLHANG